MWIIDQIISFFSKFRIRRGLKDKGKLTGRMELVHRNKAGEILHHIILENVITNTGLAEVAGLLNGDTSGAFTYLAIGTGTTGELAGDTTLETETHRESATCSRVTTVQTNDTARLLRLFTGYGGSETVSEAGAFDAAAVGVMLGRKTFTGIPINWAGGDSLQITYDFQVS